MGTKVLDTITSMDDKILGKIAVIDAWRELELILYCQPYNPIFIRVF